MLDLYVLIGASAINPAYVLCISSLSNSIHIDIYVVLSIGVSIALSIMPIYVLSYLSYVWSIYMLIYPISVVLSISAMSMV